MFALFYFFIFSFGAAIGSFLGVIVDRMNSKEPIWKGRSHCDHCRHTLHPLDLIPLLSFFLIGGKCRYCHKKLSVLYPLVEGITGISFVAAAYVVFGQSFYLIGMLPYQLMALYYFILLSALITIFFTDLRFGIIPFKLVAFALMITFVWYLLLHFVPFPSSLAIMLGLPISFFSVVGAAFGAGGLFFLLFVMTRGRGMGFGDVVYAFLMGFTLGFPQVILALYIAFLSGAAISLLLVALKKKRLKGGTIPFGPFLVVGTVVCLLWGDQLLNYVMQYFIL